MCSTLTLMLLRRKHRQTCGIGKFLVRIRSTQNTSLNLNMDLTCTVDIIASRQIGIFAKSSSLNRAYIMRNKIFPPRRAPRRSRPLAPRIRKEMYDIRKTGTQASEASWRAKLIWAYSRLNISCVQTPFLSEIRVFSP
jgi:hypothetical protein